MFLDNPPYLPWVSDCTPSPGMVVAARRLMARFSPGVQGCQLCASNDYDWTMALFGSRPDLDELVQAAEALGHDVWAIDPGPNPDSWDIVLRAIEARDPDVRKELTHRVDFGFYADVTE